MISILKLNEEQIVQVVAAYDFCYNKHADKPLLQQISKARLFAIKYINRKANCPLLEAAATVMSLIDKGQFANDPGRHSENN